MAVAEEVVVPTFEPWAEVDGGPKLKLGVLGAGMIATVGYGYLPGLRLLSDRLEICAIADPVKARAEQVAADWAIPAVYDDVDAMLADAPLDAVVNLTPIEAHYETSMKILSAGKHLVTEKPIASSVPQADDICETARRASLVVVCAPFDMLKPEWKESRRLVRDGIIGKPAFARAQSSHAGPAGLAWPTDPTSFYQKGAGPLLDMGVYGIHRTTGVLGPAKRVTAMSGITAPTRLVRGGALDGFEIPVTEDDNTLLMLDFGGSTFAVIDGTYNVLATKSPEMELFGLGGTLIVNRPGAEVGPGQLPIELYRLDAAPGIDGWVTPQTVQAALPPDRTATLCRAVLVDHLIECLRTGRPPVASAGHARHALEIMLAAKTAAREGATVALHTTFGE